MLYYQIRLILISKHKQQNKLDAKQYVRHLKRNIVKDLLAFKSNSSEILFQFSSIVVFSNPIVESEVAFVLCSKTRHIA